MNKYFLFKKGSVIKVGAIILKEYKGEWYYLYFKSITKPTRGNQLLRVRVNIKEGLEDALEREISEELQRKVKIVQPFILNIHEDREKDYTDFQYYYICLLKEKIDINSSFRVFDKDNDKEYVEELEWSFAKLSDDPGFLSRKHDMIIKKFQKWSRQTRLFSWLEEVER